MNTTISENIKKIREEIDRAALKAGRDPGEITLMAVSKTKPVESAVLAAKSGVIFGARTMFRNLRKSLRRSPNFPGTLSAIFRQTRSNISSARRK